MQAQRLLQVPALLVAVFWAAQTGAAPKDCTCAAALDTNGWCELHHVGYVAAVPISSRLVYDALDAHGHTLDLTTFTCESCRKAIATDGFCEADQIGFVNKQAYFSRLTYELARGEPTDRSRIKCKLCKANSATHGWCEHCKLGMVGNVAIHDHEAYGRAAHAADILRDAAGTIPRCEWCAVAMVTSTKCPVCKITYRDGKPLPVAAAPKPN
jgi:hypothetical protein